jgi:hypothetical protein
LYAPGLLSASYSGYRLCACAFLRHARTGNTMNKNEVTLEDVPRQCPMCKSSRYKVVTHLRDYWIKCVRCGKRGAKADTLQGAIRKWNGDMNK